MNTKINENRWVQMVWVEFGLQTHIWKINQNYYTNILTTVLKKKQGKKNKKKCKIFVNILHS